MGEIDYPGYAYGAAVAFGGIMGYMKKRSVPSLMAGVAFGSLAMFGAYSVSKDGKSGASLAPAIGTSALLCGVMGARALKSGKLMPAGMIAILSLGMLTRYSFMFYNLNTKQ
eukprot:TRINITY_DN75699_c0_g1_i1.p1 TRINITY_DN75699_c0_g1~~TRINITY_DN75699_c0_g1_i1.p1  ORF type:complete len:112 (+),score=10.18 TRINITY_DN75699_c0_g1_i1:33-368(+)